MMNFNQANKSILVISLHGYVAAEPEIGKPDTGGQVVFVLELAKRFSRLGKKVDLLTRQFEDQPKEDIMNDNLRVWRVPFGGKKFIPLEDLLARGCKETQLRYEIKICVNCEKFYMNEPVRNISALTSI